MHSAHASFVAFRIRCCSLPNKKAWTLVSTLCLDLSEPSATGATKEPAKRGWGADDGDDGGAPEREEAAAEGAEDHRGAPGPACDFLLEHILHEAAAGDVEHR